MSGVKKFVERFSTVSIAALIATLGVVVFVDAATTISTDVTTAGNLYASSTVQATGAMTAYGTFSATGLATLVNASTTQITNSGLMWVNGALTASSTLQVTGATTLYNNLTIPANYSIDTLTAGTLNIGTTTANAITIGKGAITTTFPGAVVASSTLQVTGATTLYNNLTIPANYSVDVLTAGTLNIGTTTANAITIGKSGVVTTIVGGSINQASSTIVGAQTVTGAATIGGTLTVTTTNAATSTASLGCIQTTATSTATPVKLYIGSANSSATTTINNAVIQGYVVWAYGNCP